MNKEIIKRLEELVEEISECYTSIPEEIVNELNDLTKNEWSEEEYIEFCAEYWSSNTLEETVYALLHGGEYPEKVVKKIYVWKNKKIIDLPDKKIKFKLLKLPETVDEAVICNFEDLPTEEFYNWLYSYCSEWRMNQDISEKDLKSGSYTVTFTYDFLDEYAKYKYIILRVCGNKMISLICCNLSESEKQYIILFVDKYNLHLYED